MDEIELRLQLPPASAEAVERSGLLPAGAVAVVRRSVSFDTPDRALAAAGISLGIRHDGDRRVQTVKAAGLERDTLLATDLPVPVAGLVEDADALVRAFETEVTHRSWSLADGDAVLRVAMDHGELRAADRVAPFCTIVLTSEAPDALLAFARRLDEVAPVRLEVLAAAERGSRLTAALEPAIKADPVPLTAEMTAAEAFRQVARACLRQFRLNDELLRATRAPEPLHQARVALRRLRSAFAVFRPVLGPEAARDLRERLRALAAELGAARDLDVLVARAQPGALRDRLRAEREAAHDRVAQRLDTPETRALMLEVAIWVEAGPWRADPATEEARSAAAREVAAAALARFRRKVKKDGRHLRTLEDEARHRLRKDAKKLRYAADFFAPLFARKPERRGRKAFTAALEDLQDHLGALNDLVTAPRVLDRLGLAEDPEAATLLPGRKKTRRLEDAAEALAKLLAAERYWR